MSAPPRYRDEQLQTHHALVELNGVRKHYAAGAELVRAVDGVDLRLAPGEVVALRGPSGSGKTTLLLLAAGLLRPDEGTVTYRGRSVADLSDTELADHLREDVGFVYQRFHLMPRVTAVDNAAQKLIYGGVAVRDARVRATHWLERVGMAGRLDHCPEQLSTGERQRVVVARVLACEPALILADEPTGNLDSARSRELIALLSSIAHDRGAAVLLATHDAEAAALADRRLRLRDGGLLDADDAGGPYPTDEVSPSRSGAR